MMICEECRKSGFEVEVRKLSTYGQRHTNLVNADGSHHIHLFSKSGWEWEYYEGQGEIAKWDKRA